MPARMTIDVLRSRGLDDLTQVLFHLRDRQSAKAIVRAQRDDQHAHVFLERPIEPPESAGGRVPGDPGVDHLVLESVPIDFFLQEMRIRLRLEKPQAGGQTVAQHDNLRPLVIGS